MYFQHDTIGSISIEPLNQHYNNMRFIESGDDIINDKYHYHYLSLIVVLLLRDKKEKKVSFRYSFNLNKKSSQSGKISHHYCLVNCNC